MSDLIEPGHMAFGEDKLPVSTEESYLDVYCREFGVNQQTALEQEEFWARHLGAAGANDVEKSRQLIVRVAAALAWFIEYDGDKNLAARVMALELGFKDVAGAPDGEETTLAKAASTELHVVSKQTVNKCKKSLLAMLDSMPQFAPVPLRPGERSAESRGKMSEAARQSWAGSTGGRP